MKTAGGNIDKEDKIVRVDGPMPEDVANPMEQVSWINKLLPSLSILQLSDIGIKKTFKGNKGKTLVVSDNEKYMEFKDAGIGKLTPIVLEYDASLSVDLVDNLNYILTLTGDCVLTLTNPIPGAEYNFLLIQDSTGGHNITIGNVCSYEVGYSQNTNAFNHSILTLKYLDNTFYASIKAYIGGGVYHNSGLGLLSLTDGTNWVTIADKNLGATRVYNNGDTLTEANCGKYYQRGNNHGFPFTGTFNKSRELVDTTGYGPGNYYDSDIFIYTTEYSLIYDWSRPINNNLWGETTDTVTARQGPCSAGYHVCSYNDLATFSTILTYFLTNGIAPDDMFKIYLKMPYAGYISSTLIHTAVGSGLYIWTSSYNRLELYNGYSYTYPLVNMPRMTGCPIRPFKDTVVIPDSTWTKIL